MKPWPPTEGPIVASDADSVCRHGTRAVDPVTILNSEEGFDHRCSREGLWGAGAYFAVESRYSQNYAHNLPTAPQKQLVLARVLVGDSKEMAPARHLRRPPDKEGREGASPASPGIAFAKGSYDSVTGHTGGSKIFVIYSHGGRAYPEYLITYQ